MLLYTWSALRAVRFNAVPVLNSCHNLNVKNIVSSRVLWVKQGISIELVLPILRMTDDISVIFFSMETILKIRGIELKMSVIHVHCHLMHRNTEKGSW